MSHFNLTISGKTHVNPRSDSLFLEWLETNGLGGYASSTISGSHSRSYHGLFAIQSTLANERLILLSKLDEKILFKEKSFELSAATYPGTVHPKGFEYLQDFSKELFPSWNYHMEDLKIKKELCYIYGKNTLVLRYESSQDISLDLRPFYAFRNYHSLQKRKEFFIDEITFSEGVLKVTPLDTLPSVFIQAESSSYEQNIDWYYNYELNEEKMRGFSHLEDLFTVGGLTIPLKANEPKFVIISTSENNKSTAAQLMKSERERRIALLETANAKDPLAKTLTLAADQFIFRRSDTVTSIIAGYHWFTDWGRDTMISLPGLCLATKRFVEAKEILLGYSSYIKDGLIPNRFPDKGTEPEYHTVDAALWYIVACYEYVKASKDTQFIKIIAPKLHAIIKNYQAGTKYKIKADTDGLISCGDETTNLTWMDARVHCVPVTPRNGKPVEISCLWYNSLKIMAEFLGDAQLEKDAELTKSSFLKKFWNNKGYLNDRLQQDDTPDFSVRPNQIFALSLPFPLVDKEKALSVLSVIERDLLTNAGLRTLSPGDSRYRGIYGGSPESRDSAYHQGTVWMWLLGHYIKAARKFGSEKSFKLDAIEKDLARSGVGTLSEIYDGDYPHTPRGCIAQAWSVGTIREIL